MDSLESIRREVIECKKCPLSQYRKRAVPGFGNEKSRIMLVGEAPGREEDERGLPFVGRAGKLLDEILGNFGIDRNMVYITNVVKCRPPNNRRPKREEVLACVNYLVREIQLINPKVIVALGATSSNYLFNESFPSSWKGKSKKVSSIRGNIGSLNIGGKSFKVLATFHPASVLRNPKLREKLEEDLRKATELWASSDGSV
ncbi:MAG: uracil-DNA glycosylase [Fervidicoccaceae archaeon]